MNAAKSKKFSKTRSQNKSAVKNKIKKTVAKTDHGLIMVFTGNGKGKTTAAFGQALRAIGQGYNVFIVQFMKGRKYGEYIAARKYLPGLTILRAGLEVFMRDNPATITRDGQKVWPRRKKPSKAQIDIVILMK